MQKQMKVKVKSDKNILYIPKHYVDNEYIFLKLYLISEYSYDIYTFMTVDENTYSDYFVLNINLLDVPDGEYVYDLRPIFNNWNAEEDKYMEIEKDCVSKGLIIIGDAETKVKEYLPDNEIKNTEDIKYYE